MQREMMAPVSHGTVDRFAHPRVCMAKDERPAAQVRHDTPPTRPVAAGTSALAGWVVTLSV